MRHQSICYSCDISLFNRPTAAEPCPGCDEPMEELPPPAESQVVRELMDRIRPILPEAFRLLRLPAGVAPTSPVDGDCWITTASEDEPVEQLPPGAAPQEFREHIRHRQMGLVSRIFRQG